MITEAEIEDIEKKIIPALNENGNSSIQELCGYINTQEKNIITLALSRLNQKGKVYLAGDRLIQAPWGGVGIESFYGLLEEA